MDDQKKYNGYYDFNENNIKNDNLYYNDYSGYGEDQKDCNVDCFYKQDDESAENRFSVDVTEDFLQDDNLDENLLEAIKKRAYGFAYEEANYDYNIDSSDENIFCKKRNKLYTELGYLKVKPLKIFGESVKCEFFIVKNFFKNKKALKAFFAKKSTAKKFRVSNKGEICLF